MPLLSKKPQDLGPVIRGLQLGSSELPCGLLAILESLIQGATDGCPPSSAFLFLCRGDLVGDSVPTE